jgi:hypothetical protein
MGRLQAFVHHTSRAALLGAFVFVPACGGEVEVEQPGAAPAAAKPERHAAGKVSDVVKGLLLAGEPQEVLVVYDGAAIETRARADQGLPEASERRSERESRRVFVESAFRDAKAAVHAGLDAAHVRVVAPLLAAYAGLAAFLRLAHACVPTEAHGMVGDAPGAAAHHPSLASLVCAWSLATKPCAEAREELLRVAEGVDLPALCRRVLSVQLRSQARRHAGWSD